MNRENIDMLEYSGYVNITTCKKKTHIKNSGTANLFELFARLLAGYIVNPVELPRTIMLYYEVNGQKKAALNQPIAVTSAYRIINNQHCAVFTGAISDTNLHNEVENTQYYLELRNGTINTNALAYIPIDTSILKQVESGRQALIEWVMTVSNVSKSTII